MKERNPDGLLWVWPPPKLPPEPKKPDWRWIYLPALGFVGGLCAATFWGDAFIHWVLER